MEPGDIMTMSRRGSTGVCSHTHGPVHMERRQVEHGNAVLDLNGDSHCQHHYAFEEPVQAFFLK